MWRSEKPQRGLATITANRQLPFHVRPAPDEALISWLLRLASRLEVSTDVLVGEAFGIKHHGGRSNWWRRPHTWTLKRISDQTGISADRLRQMTLMQWSSYDDDETSERFSERVLTTRVPECREFHHAVCHDCLKAHSTPYLRLSWTVGWLAICSHHGTILTARCEHCRAKLRPPPSRQVFPFSPLRCLTCGEELWCGDYKADTRVLVLQEALLRGKQTGSAELPGLGSFIWPEVVGLADALLKAIWKSTVGDEVQKIQALFREDFGFRWLEPPLRYRDLALLAWLTGGWPTSPGAKVGIEMLRRWLSRESHTHDAVAQQVRQRLLALSHS